MREIPVGELRMRVSAVFQDFMTYELSAHDNIALGSRDPGSGGATQAGFGAGREAVAAAASAAGLHELLSALPAGYDSMLSRIFADDGPLSPSRALPGVQLSGGQWQRVALARSAMRPDARLFILDEPSAGLDPLAEADQRYRLRALLTGKIGLLIGHRLDGIRRADLIVVLRDGSIAEQGSHDALMRSEGEYARLFRTQAQGFLNPVTLAGRRKPAERSDDGRSVRSGLTRLVSRIRAIDLAGHRLGAPGPNVTALDTRGRSRAGAR
jgi:ATP-binding cassette subfamily B protein